MPRGNPGIPKTPEHRKKLSESHKGKPGYWRGKKIPSDARQAMSIAAHNRRLTQEHKDKIASAMRGRIISETTRQKFVGKKHSIDTRLKMSLAQHGEKGSNWQGGKSSINERARQSLEFAEWRKAIFVRDNYTCQQCKTQGGILHPHHILSFAQYPQFRYNINNGVTLCEKCHRQIHKGKTNEHDLPTDWSRS